MGCREKRWLGNRGRGVGLGGEEGRGRGDNCPNGDIPQPFDPDSRGLLPCVAPPDPSHTKTTTGQNARRRSEIPGRFKSYSGSQISSSRSLNEVHIHRLQPKSATKCEFFCFFFHLFLSLIVWSRRHRLEIANEADEVLLGKRPR